MKEKDPETPPVTPDYRGATEKHSSTPLPTCIFPYADLGADSACSTYYVEEFRF